MAEIGRNSLVDATGKEVDLTPRWRQALHGTVGRLKNNLVKVVAAIGVIGSLAASLNQVAKLKNESLVSVPEVSRGNGVESHPAPIGLSEGPRDDLHIEASSQEVQEPNLEVPPDKFKPAPSYEVKLVLPMVMEGADIRVDGRSPIIVQDLGNFITIRVPTKSANYHLEVQKGDRICSQEVWIGPRTLRLQPCG